MYKMHYPIPNDPFETLTPLSLSLTQKEFIDIILDVQVVSIKDDEIQ